MHGEYGPPGLLGLPVLTAGSRETDLLTTLYSIEIATTDLKPNRISVAMASLIFYPHLAGTSNFNLLTDFNLLPDDKMLALSNLKGIYSRQI